MNKTPFERPEKVPEEIMKEVYRLERNIRQNEYWLRYGGMSNYMKIRWRKRDLKADKQKLSELKSQYNITD